MVCPKTSSLFYLYAWLSVLLLPACTGITQRPARQISYAEAAFQSATLAGAETSQPNLYQLSRDALMQARAAYRLKNFKLARQLALKARLVAEDAELKALRAATSPAAPAPSANANEER
jgi:hypothetical protein